MTSEETHIKLVASRVTYYSPNDEAAFFEWIRKIPSIINYEGKGSDIFIYISDKNMDEFCLREIIALFKRYGIEMRQLAIFDQEMFSEWFKSPNTYWFNEVF